MTAMFGGKAKTAPPPKHAIDWKGNDWTPDSKEKAAHPNSAVSPRRCAIIRCSIRMWKTAKAFRSARSFSAVAAATPCRSFSRRAIGSTAPISARPWARETTAAATGAVGQVRRDPMAMLPFCGYNMGQYFKHWLEIGPRLTNPPLIFHVNWFRKGADGKFLWPGFGENMRVLKWIIDRCEGQGGARGDGDRRHSAPGRFRPRGDRHHARNDARAILDQTRGVEKRTRRSERILRLVRQRHAAGVDRAARQSREAVRQLATPRRAGAYASGWIRASSS